ncbi:pyrimidine reductase family protein [Desertihabitans brevis]|nr:pyrimidine reductase family protein [Desertihabitans brevis]
MERWDAVGEVDDLEAELLVQGDHLRTLMVASADGAATIAGRVDTLTSPADQRLLLTARAVADVVLVGAGTVRAEGYGPLVVEADISARRGARGQTPHPGLAVVTATGDLDLEHPLFTEAVTRPLVVTTEGCPRRDRIEQVADVVTAGAQTLDVRAAVAALRARGLRRIGCEGGARLNQALLAADLVDELVLTTAPLLVGGEAPRIVHGAVLDPPRPLRLVGVLRSGDHLFTRWSLR